MCLYNFIEDYKKDKEAKCKEEGNLVILETKMQDNDQKYNVYKKLYIDSKTAKPVKMEVEEINKKMLVYILYNEIKINSINKEEVLAFKLNIQEKDI